VVDTTDCIETKTVLLRYCQVHNIKVISVGDLRGKSDPTKLQIRDISESRYDLVLNVVRIRLKNLKKLEETHAAKDLAGENKKIIPPKVRIVANNHEDEIQVMYSIEQANDKSVDIIQGGEKIKPVLGPVPAIFGQALSSYVLCQLAGQSYHPTKVDAVKFGSYQRLYEKLSNFVIERPHLRPLADFDNDDVYFVANMCAWRSVSFFP
jgi:tRNA A37 threonylcarbamoyladenosine dehydratase